MEEIKDVTPKKRSIEEVQKEYSQFCAQAGENQYKIKVLEQTMHALNQRINDLNVEAEQLAKEKQDGQS
jgi:hypothetical protein